MKHAVCLVIGTIFCAIALDAIAGDGSYTCAYPAYMSYSGGWVPALPLDEMTLHDEIVQSAACAETTMCVEMLFPGTSRMPYWKTCPLNANDEKITRADLDRAASKVESLDDECFSIFALLAARMKESRYAPLLAKEASSNHAARALAAVEALRELGGEESASAMLQAANHWYPPVRLIAQQAIDSIDTTSDDDELSRVATYDVVHFLTERNLQRYCDRQTESWRAPPDFRQHEARQDESGDDYAGEGLARIDGWPVCRGTTFRAQLGGGQLVGSGLGEWGGAVYFFRPPELPRPLIEDVVGSIQTFDDSAAALASLAHLSVHFTTIYRFELDAAGVPTAEITAELPDPTWRMAWRKDRSALIIGDSGAVYDVPASGTPRVLGCVKPAPMHMREIPWGDDPEPFE